MPQLTGLCVHLSSCMSLSLGNTSTPQPNLQGRRCFGHSPLLRCFSMSTAWGDRMSAHNECSVSFQDVVKSKICTSMYTKRIKVNRYTPVSYTLKECGKATYPDFVAAGVPARQEPV